jgi:hypothetical protein
MFDTEISAADMLQIIRYLQKWLQQHWDFRGVLASQQALFVH